MQSHIRVAALLGLAFVLAGARPALYADTKSPVEEIRKELMQLPYYSVFDYLAFSYDRGTVTLMGYAYHLGLKQDAVRAAKRAPGVDQVIDKIEELPVSQFDDELRYRIARSIYNNSNFWNYAIMPNPPIHIVVEHGRVTLTGVVQSNVDRMLARSLATQFGALSVTNALKTDAEIGDNVAKSE